MTCTVDGCGKETRSPGSALCKMHYHRQYRHGSVDIVATGVGTERIGKYRHLYLPKHPLAGRNGKVYAHRAALYEKIGPGSHRCFDCEASVRWEAGKAALDQLHVDHIDNNRENNAPENLRPACRTCNAKRGQEARSRRLREAGWFSVNDTVGKLQGSSPAIQTIG